MSRGIGATQRKIMDHMRTRPIGRESKPTVRSLASRVYGYQVTPSQYESIRQSLASLVKRELLVRDGDGRYWLPEEYIEVHVMSSGAYSEKLANDLRGEWVFTGKRPWEVGA